jgi:glycosyltransferase involved in cell wall biosynthesis
MQDANPLVSVVMPVYNAERFLRVALVTIFNQTYKNLEVIVVNDGSIDQTENIIINEYPNTVRYYIQSNSGPSKARNLGIKKAIGKYIVFLDVDDFWHPNKIEEQVKSFLNNSDYAMLYTDYQTIENNQPAKFSIETRDIKLQSCSFQEILFGKSIHTSTVMVRKEVLLAVGGYNDALLTGEDIELYLKIAKEYLIGYLDKSYVIVRKHDNNLTKMRRNVSGIIEGLKNLCKLYPGLSRDKVIKKAFAYHYFRKGRELFNWDMRAESIPFFINSIKAAPFNLKGYLYICSACLPEKVVIYIRNLKKLFKNKNLMLKKRSFV